MRAKFRVSLYSDDGEKFFGEGPRRLLLGVRRHGSLRAAAQDMDMAYTKALHILKCAEDHCGFPLTRRRIGGEGGGGSVLTPEAEELLARYEAFQAACGQEADRLFREFFADLWPNDG